MTLIEFNFPSCASMYVGASARAFEISVSDYLEIGHRTRPMLQTPPPSWQ